MAEILPDSERSWRAPFMAKLTASTNTAGTFFYSFTEQLSDGDGNYVDALPGRTGDATSTPAREINNRDVDVSGTPIYRLWTRGAGTDGDPVYEFDSGSASSGGSTCCDCAFDDDVSIVGQASTSGISPTYSFTVSPMPGAGQFVLLALSYSGSPRTVTPADTWTVLYHDLIGSNTLYVAWRLEDGRRSTPFSYDFNFSGGSLSGLGAALHRVDGATNVEAHDSTFGSSSTITAPTVTSSGADRLLIVVAAEDSGPHAAQTSVEGMTAAFIPSLNFVMWRQAVNAGATGARTFTRSGSSDWDAVSVLVEHGDAVSGATSAGDTVACGRIVSIGTGPPTIAIGSVITSGTAGYVLAVGAGPALAQYDKISGGSF